uniref:cDNA FLJ53090, moderately similar to RNA-binding motif, single-stranded-interacting protein 2 n=1 Tax=Homo sapiens TaxID=9606 RepID=B7Z5Y7_HUMAN|nr:unnamed protein product [Homo sapiens]
MLLSVTSRPGISTFGYNRNNKKPYVSLAQQMAPPSPSNSTPNSSSGSNGNDQLSKTNLYIRGLQPGTTDQDLVKLCQPYGKIVSTKAILDKTTNKCKGYGFVDFDSPSAAQKAVTALKASGVQAQMAKQQEQDPTTALQNGFYPAPYNITPNRMLAQSALSPYLSSPVSSYQRVTQTSPLQVPNPSWMHHHSYLMQPSGSVLTPGMDHPISLQPASMMGPLTQQLGHLSLSSTGTYMPTAAAMQGAYISQYTPVPSSSVSVEESSGQQNQVAVDAPSEHGVYSFQFNK